MKVSNVIKGSFWGVISTGLFLALLVLAPASAQSQSRLAANVSSAGVQITADMTGSEIISLDVRTPEGAVEHAEYIESPAVFLPAAGSPDGSYRYEVQLVDSESGKMLERVSGSFTLKYGQIVALPKPDKKRAQGFLPGVTETLEQFAHSVLDFLLPEAQAADLTAESNNPGIYFLDDLNGPGYDYHIYTFPCGTSDACIRFFKYPGISAYPFQTIVDDVSLADNKLYIDYANSRVGINNSIPTYTLDAIGNAISLKESTASDAHGLELGVYHFLSFTDNYIYSRNNPLYISTPGTTANDIWLMPSSAKVGINTETPAANLHVEGSNFPAFKTTRNVSFTGGDRGVAAFELASTGSMLDGFGPSFEFWISDNTVTATSAVVSMGGFRDGCDTCGKFIVRTGPTLGTTQLVIGSNGQWGIGTAAPRAGTKIDTSTGAYLSTGGAWVNYSSRSGKDNVENLNAEKAMKAMEGLNPVTFTYKSAPEEKHVGFIAEDVPEIVATKDRNGLSAMDITAVLTKVVQEQQKALEQQKEIIAQLTERIATLERESRLRGSVAAAMDTR